MYQIAEYDERYRPYDKSGGELRNPEWVKMPCKPTGEGLRALLEYKRGGEIFAIWCLLLQKATKEKKPENRGKLLNHKGSPATITEIAKGISHSNKIRLVKTALSALVEMGWVINDEIAEVTSAKLPQTSAKSRVPKSRVPKSKYADFVFLFDSEHKKLIELYGDKNIRPLIVELSNYIGSSGKQYKSHYFTLLNWARRKELPQLTASKEKSSIEQRRLEKERQRIRKEDGQYYQEKTTKELELLLESKSSKHIVRRWLIKEILRDKLKHGREKSNAKEAIPV